MCVKSLWCCVWKNRSILYKLLWRSMGRGCWCCNLNGSWRISLWPVSNYREFLFMLSFVVFNIGRWVEKLECLIWVVLAVVFCFRSGREFEITATRLAASNPLLKEAFVEALAHPWWEYACIDNNRYQFHNFKVINML